MHFHLKNVNSCYCVLCGSENGTYSLFKRSTAICNILVADIHQNMCLWRLYTLALTELHPSLSLFVCFAIFTTSYLTCSELSLPHRLCLSRTKLPPSSSSSISVSWQQQWHTSFSKTGKRPKEAIRGGKSDNRQKAAFIIFTSQSQQMTPVFSFCCGKPYGFEDIKGDEFRQKREVRLWFLIILFGGLWLKV